jgi:carboxypeptidase D
MDTAMEIQREQIERMRTMMGAQMEAMNQRLAAPPSTVNFSNPKAKEFLVDGTKIPKVNFDAGPSWAGLLPISGAPDETRKLFFWFWPTNNPANTKDLVFWTNGMRYSSPLYF